MSENSTLIEAVVLRFRDLATGPGDTIRLHREIGDKGGHVWWAWWNKSGEVIPGDTFRQLKKRLSEVSFFLFDSDRLQLHPAVCEDITWNTDHQRIPSPEEMRTPAYYRTQEYLAWFRLRSIADPVEAPHGVLQRYSYLSVDELFLSKKSQYDIFYGKQVRSLPELKQQDRTVWFLREFRNEDRTHEVSLLQAKQVAPSHFPEEYSSSQSRHLLWLSDLHFSEQHHQFPLTPSPNKSHLALAIEKAAKTHKIDNFAGVLVSGDLTWSAAEGEFTMFRAFLGQMLRSPSSLDNYRLALCPGNHDLAFTATPDNKTAELNDSVTPEEAKAGYSKLYRELFYLAPNDHLSMGRRYLLGKHFPVEVACLNSSLLEQKKGWFQGHGFVGQQQLDKVAEGMGWTLDPPSHSPRALRIVMMHHHLVPVSYASEPWGGVQYSVVLDAGRLRTWLEQHEVDLVIHGHMHEAFVSELSRPGKTPSGHNLRIVGLGSTGVVANHRGEHANTFGVLTAERGGLRVQIFDVSPEGSKTGDALVDYCVPLRLIAPVSD